MNTLPQRSLFVVGDDGQSIYSFRGSKVDIILNFAREYPGAREIILNQNYRSTKQILDLAERVLAHNVGQKKKDLFTVNQESIDVRYYLARNERDEAEYIVRQLYELYVARSTANTPNTLISTGTNNNTMSSVQDLTLEWDVEHTGYPHQNQTTATDDIAFEPDPISSLFDVYLDTKQYAPYSPLRTSNSPISWSVPQHNWSQVKQLNDVVVLYRTHSQSRAIEDVFLRYHVPYRLLSGTRFLDRKEIRDVIAMLRFLNNENDKISFSRFLPLVLDGVGPKTLDKIIAFLDDFEFPLSLKIRDQTLSLIERMRACRNEHSTLIGLTKELIIATGYARYLKHEYPNREEFEQRMENIGELYSLMFSFDELTDITLQERLTQFLTHVSLLSQVDTHETDNTPKVNLMSLHQSKGLEYETVFLVGAEDGILPHQNSFMEEKSIEEEVRLAYVGVTRAKKYLYIISAESRVQFGQVKMNPVSRIFRPFLDTYIKRIR